MSVRAILKVLTILAGVGLLTGLAMLFLGSPDLVARISPSSLLVAAVATLAGAIYLQASKPRSPLGKEAQSTSSTIGFGILVVIALFMIAFFATYN